MAITNPVYVAALSSPVPVPNASSTSDFLTNSDQLIQSARERVTRKGSDMESNVKDLFSKSIDLPEVNESGIMTGAARRSGGSNVGGVFGLDQKKEMFLPFKTQSEQEEYIEEQQEGLGDKAYDYAGKMLGFNPIVAAYKGLYKLADKVTGGKVTETVDKLGETKVGKGVRKFRDAGKRFLNRLSDRRLKTNIKLIGKSEQGYNIYSFKFIDPSYGEGVYQGVIADEMPEQVISKNEDGYNMVDYSMIDVEFKKIDEYSRVTKTNNKNMGKIIAKSGVELSTPARCRPAGKRVMTSRDMTIKSDLSVDNIMYKGNANLLAQR